MTFPTGHQPANCRSPVPSTNGTIIVSTPTLPSTQQNVPSPFVFGSGSSGSQFVPSMVGRLFTGQGTRPTPAAGPAATNNNRQFGTSSIGQTGASSSIHTGASSSGQTGASSNGQTIASSSGQTSAGNSQSTARLLIKPRRQPGITLQGSAAGKRRLQPRSSTASSNVNLLNNLPPEISVRAPNPPPPLDLDIVTTAFAPAQPPNWDQYCDTAIKSPDLFIKLKVEPFTPEYRILAELVHSAPNLEVTGIQRVVNVHLWKQFLDMRDYLLRSKSESDDVELMGDLRLNDTQNQQQFQACVNFNANKTIPSYADNVALLLHCTDGSVDNILSEGLDERLANDSGFLGRGIYFTDNPSKAAHYDNNNVFIVCAVFLGDCSQVIGRKPYVRGQEKTVSQKRHKYDGYFDSIVGCPATRDNEFVIYDRRQCVPMYLIRYLEKTKPASTSARPKMYAEARRNYPPFSWKPAPTQNLFLGHGFMTSPPNFVPARVNRWPFFAQTIFALMSQGSDAPTTEAPIPTDNMAQLRSMGFTNDQINAQKLTENNNDLNRTVEALLTLSQPPPASAFGQPRIFPSIMASTPTFTFGLPTAPAPSTNRFLRPTSAPAQTCANPFHPTAASSAVPTANPFRPSTAVTPGFFFPSPTTTGLFGNTAATAPAALPAQAQTLTTAAPASNGSAAQQQEECLICRDEPTSWKTLPCCSQKLCTACYAQLETSGKTMSGSTCAFVKCPFCKRIDGIEIGTCPDGEMSLKISNCSLDGHEGYFTIEVRYMVRAWNLHRIGYLPNSPEGNRALNLLKIAWDRRLVFSIGTSRTTGQSNVLVWNIHHKTGTSGGVQNHAYPDPTYLDRLMDELKQYGIQ